MQLPKSAWLEGAINPPDRISIFLALKRKIENELRYSINIVHAEDSSHENEQLE